MIMKYMIFIIPIVLLKTVFLAMPLLAKPAGDSKPSKAEVIQKIQKLQIPFITNAGQTDDRVKFYTYTFGGSVFITDEGEIVYSFPYSDSEAIHGKDPSIKRLVLKEELIKARIHEVKGEEKTKISINYFRGNDSSRWKSNISAYEVVNLGELYKGIQLKLKAHGNNVEKLFYIKPDADPEEIKIKLSGAHTLRVNKAGQLEAETDFGNVKFTKPVAYQEIDGKRVEVTVEYRIQKPRVRSQNVDTNPLTPKSEIRNPNSEIVNVYGFKVAGYDKKSELIIDPLLASTYLGGLNSDYGNSVTVDPGGNIYVAGYTESSDFPTTTGACDISYNSGDIFVSKLNGDLTHLLASTYLGGSSDDYVRSIAIDSGKNIYVTGQTSSSDFPTTTGAYDTSKSGYSDAFLVKINGDLNGLIASTFFGGSDNDYAHSVVSDPSGIIVCVAGRTLSSDFPTTPGVYDTVYNNDDVFIAKLNWNLTHLLASTFLGGSDNDYGNSITIDSERNICVSGETWSSDFPATTGTYDTSFNGGFGDVFVSKLNWDLTRLLASTFLGGTSDDSANSIATDSRGNIFVAGQTESLDFPTTPAAHDTSFHNGDAFVSKLNGNLTKLLASTYLGGSGDDVGNAIAIGSGGNIYVAGHTASSDFPTTPGAYNTSKSIYFDAFISKLSGDLTSVLASTFLGGNYRDIARSIAIDSRGNIYVTGETRSSNFPVTPGAYDTSYNGDVNISYAYDTFVSKFDSNLSAPPSAKKVIPSGLSNH